MKKKFSKVRIPKGYKRLKAGTILKAGDKFNYARPISKLFNYWSKITAIGSVLVRGGHDSRINTWDLNGWIVIRPIKKEKI